MQEITNVIEDIVYTNPQLLLALDNSEKIGLHYLPYSVGIEIECYKKPDFNLEAFKAIPHIIEVRTDSWEQRYRIPNGLEGLLCLYNLCDTLVEYSEINKGSGIHLQIDFTDYYDKVDKEFVNAEKSWVLEELDTWNYKGTYNSRTMQIGKGGWAGFRDTYKTLEIRICEMSFNYSVLAKRILHANNICRRLKQNLSNKADVKGYYAILNQLGESIVVPKSNEDNIEQIINSRKIRC